MKFVITDGILEATHKGYGDWSDSKMKLDNQAMEYYLIEQGLATASDVMSIDCVIDGINFDFKVPRASHAWPQLSAQQFSAIGHGKGNVDYYAFYERIAWPTRQLRVGDELEVRLFKVLSWNAYMKSMSKSRFAGSKPWISGIRQDWCKHEELDESVMNILRYGERQLVPIEE